MMLKKIDILLTAFAPIIWGSTYYVTTEYLPDGYPITVAMLRALPAGLVLLMLVRRLPQAGLWGKVFILGALNFSIFWVLLFVAAYRLPGGVAATVGAVQPLIVILLSHAVLNSPIYFLSILGGLGGIAGVGLLVLTPDATLDTIGVAAGLGGAISMAAGTVLSRKWLPKVTLLAFTAWQLTAGGLLLLPFAFWLEPTFPDMNASNILGISYLGLIGAALTYMLWFRGLQKIEPSAVSILGFLSPVTALILGWAFLGQSLSTIQTLGVLAVLISIWIGQIAIRHPRIASAAS